jgi:hypothetical protein
MKKIFASLLSVFMLSAVFCGVANAQSTTSVMESQPSFQLPIDINNARIVTQKDRDFVISFDLINNTIDNFPQMKYALHLMKVYSSSSYDIVDEKVYDSDTFSITSQYSSTSKTISYSVPQALPAGNYSLSIDIGNNSGYIFNSFYFGNIEIKSNSTSPIEIIAVSCHRYVSNKLHQSGLLYINATDTLAVKCQVKNSSSKDVIVLSKSETRYDNPFGDIASTNSINPEQISIKPGLNDISINLPVGSIPRGYYVSYVLSSLDGQKLSKGDSFNYLIKGLQGMIESTIFDKSFYKAGDVASLSILVPIYNDANQIPIQGTLIINVSSNSKDSCSATTTTQISSKKSILNIPINITKDCYNPTAQIVLSTKIENGKEINLDKKDFKVITPENYLPKNNNVLFMIIFAILALIIVTLLIKFIGRRRGITMFMILFITATSFGFTRNVSAITCYPNPSDATRVNGVFFCESSAGGNVDTGGLTWSGRNVSTYPYAGGFLVWASSNLNGNTYTITDNNGKYYDHHLFQATTDSNYFHFIAYVKVPLATPSNISYGASSVISWNSIGAGWCDVLTGTNGSYTPWRMHGGSNGSQTWSSGVSTGALYGTTNFHIICGTGYTPNLDTSADIPVTVAPLPILTASEPTYFGDKSIITYNGLTTLSTCSIIDLTHNRPVSGYLTTNGSFVDNYSLTTDTTYSMTCSISGSGSNTVTATVHPSKLKPYIPTFHLDFPGGWGISGTITWTTPNSNTCNLTKSIDGNSGTVMPVATSSGTYIYDTSVFRDSVSHTITFNLSCTNANGSTGAGPLNIVTTPFGGPYLLLDNDDSASGGTHKPYNPNLTQVGSCKIEGYFTCDKNSFSTPLQVSLTLDPSDPINLSSTWKPQDIGAHTWSSITTNNSNTNSIFVAVAKDGSVATSSDGMFWHVITTISQTASWNYITYVPNKNLFVAVGSNGTHGIMTSPDGSNWTLRTTPANNWTSVAYNNINEYIAVSSDGSSRAISSVDNTSSWQPISTISSSGAWSSIIFNGQFIALSSNGSAVTTPSGSVWTAQSISAASHPWSSMAYSNSTTTAVATDGFAVTTSDGIHWTARSIPNQSVQKFVSVIYDAVGKRFVAISTTGSIVISSDNGVTWTVLNASTISNTWQSIVSGYSVVNESGTNIPTPVLIAVSLDGNNRAMSLANESYPGLASLASAVIDSNTCGLAQGGGDKHDIGFSIPQASALVDGKTHNVIITSYGVNAADPPTLNGQNVSTTTKLTCLPNSSVNPIGDLNTAGNTSPYVCQVNGWTCDPKKPSQQLNVDLISSAWATTTAPNHQWWSIAYGNSTFVAVGLDQAVAYSKDNGVSWTSVTLPTSLSSTQWYSVTYGGGKFLATGRGTTANSLMTSPDGITWAPQSSAADTTNSCVTIGAGRSCYGDAFGTYNQFSAYGNGKFIAVSPSDGVVQVSADGSNWSGYYMPLTTVSISPRFLIFGGGKFVMSAVTNQGGTSYANDVILVSTDGINWTRSNIPESTTGIAATYNPFPPYMMGPSYINGTPYISTYKNLPYGIGNMPYWVAATSPVTGITDNCSGLSLAYGNGTFEANNSCQSSTGNTLMTSVDGITWTTQAIRTKIDTILPGGLMGYANGQFISSGSGSGYITSSDGINWSNQLTPITTGGYGMNSLAYNNGILVTTNSNGGIMISGLPIDSDKADKANLPNVNPSSICTPNNHEYSFTIPPSSPLVDGKKYTVSVIAHGVDASGALDGLTGSFSTTTLTCTPPPFPGISLSAKPAGAPYGSSTTITWSVTNSDTCTISAPNGDKYTSTNASVNFVTSVLTSNQIYTLVCSNSFGPKTQTLAIPVVPAITLTATPKFVDAGGKTTLKWNTVKADSCSLTGNGDTSTATSSSGFLTSAISSSVTYTLVCSNSAGSNTVTLVVGLTPPSIESFIATPSSVLPGDSTKISWVAKNSNSCSLVGDNGDKYTSTLSTANFTSSKLVNTGDDTVYVTYTLTCTNTTGGKVENSIAVPVGAKMITDPTKTTKKPVKQPCVSMSQQLMCQVASTAGCTVLDKTTGATISSTVTDGVLTANTTGLQGNDTLVVSCTDNSQATPDVEVTGILVTPTYPNPTMTCSSSQTGSGAGNIYVNKSMTWTAAGTGGSTITGPVSWHGTNIPGAQTTGTSLNNIYTGVGVKDVWAVAQVFNSISGLYTPGVWCHASTTVKVVPGATIEI